MAGSVRIIDQVADATDGPFVLVLDQSAEGPQPAARVRVLDQKATIGLGVLARVRILSQSAVTQSAGYVPATIGASNGSGQWLPYRLRASDGSGTWS